MQFNHIRLGESAASSTMRKRKHSPTRVPARGTCSSCSETHSICGSFHVPVIWLRSVKLQLRLGALQCAGEASWGSLGSVLGNRQEKSHWYNKWHCCSQAQTEEQLCRAVKRLHTSPAEELCQELEGVRLSLFTCVNRALEAKMVLTDSTPAQDLVHGQAGGGICVPAGPHDSSLDDGNAAPPPLLGVERPALHEEAGFAWSGTTPKYRSSPLPEQQTTQPSVSLPRAGRRGDFDYPLSHHAVLRKWLVCQLLYGAAVLLAGWAATHESAEVVTPVRQLLPRPTTAPLPPLHPGPRAACAHTQHGAPKPVQKLLFPIEEEPGGSSQPSVPTSRPEQQSASEQPATAPDPYADMAGLPARLRRIRVAPGLHLHVAPVVTPALFASDVLARPCRHVHACTHSAGHVHCSCCAAYCPQGSPITASCSGHGKAGRPSSWGNEVDDA